MGRAVMGSSLNVKRGVALGAFMLIILGIPNAARSDAPVLVFAETILFVLLVAVPVVGGALAFRRLRAKPLGAEDMPPLNVRRAVLVGFVVGVVVQATVSLRDSTPLLTFISNVATVLWVALLVALVALAIERHRLRHTVTR